MITTGITEQHFTLKFFTICGMRAAAMTALLTSYNCLMRSMLIWPACRNASCHAPHRDQELAHTCAGYDWQG
jgi:hypothetical protein